MIDGTAGKNEVIRVEKIRTVINGVANIGKPNQFSSSKQQRHYSNGKYVRNDEDKKDHTGKVVPIFLITFQHFGIIRRR